MAVKRGEGLLMRAQPLGAAEQISRRVVDLKLVDGALLLDADPILAGPINTVLTKKGVRVNELRPLSNISLLEEGGSERSARTLPEGSVMQMHRLAVCAIICLGRGEEH